MLKEEARLDGQCAQLWSKKILSTKDIKAKGPVAIMINLMKTPLLCTAILRVIWVKRAEVNIKTYGNWKSF